jgi:hypothetical protein
MRVFLYKFKKTWLCVRIYFLKKELRRRIFTIGGYRDGMVRISGVRFLDSFEVKIVHRLRRKGQLIAVGTETITSPGTGFKYTDTTYLLK